MDELQIGFDPGKYMIHITETHNMNAALNLLVLKHNNQPVCELHTLFLPKMFLNLWWAKYFTIIG